MNDDVLNLGQCLFANKSFDTPDSRWTITCWSSAEICESHACTLILIQKEQLLFMFMLCTLERCAGLAQSNISSGTHWFGGGKWTLVLLLSEPTCDASGWVSGSLAKGAIWFSNFLWLNWDTSSDSDFNLRVDDCRITHMDSWWLAAAAAALEWNTGIANNPVDEVTSFDFWKLSYRATYSQSSVNQGYPVPTAVNKVCHCN